MSRRQKYNVRKIETWEGVFDSAREYERWIELKAMRECGMISDLRRQVVFELIPKQKLKEPRINAKKKRQLTEPSITYIADFVYTENGQEIVEDVKGYTTDVYKLKRRLMLWIHGVQIKEVY